MRMTRATLKLTTDQAAAVAAGFGAMGGAFSQAGSQAGASAQGIEQAARALKDVKKASDDVSGGLSSTSSGIKVLGTSLGGLALAAVSFQAIKGVVEGLVDSATKSQSLTAAFTAIAGSAQEGQKQLEFIRGTADKLGFSFTTLAGSYKGLSAATRGTTLEGAATRDIFTAVATASRVLQLSTQDTGGILLALQQIISKGTVQSEELRGQIGERLPGAFSIAARAMGVTTQELGKLLEAGAVASNVFIPRFADQLQKEFAGGAEAASKTFAAATERLGNAFARLGEEVARSGLLDHLGKMLDKLTGIISAGPKAADALRGIATAQTEKDLNLSTPGFPASTQSQALIQAVNEQLAAKQAEIDAVRKHPPLAFGPGGVDDVSANVLRQLEIELVYLEKAKADLLRAVGRAAERVVAQDEGLGSIPTSRYVRAQDLTKQLTLQGKELQDALAKLDVQATLAPGSTIEIIEEKVKLLDKAIKALQATLATNKDLVPLFQGTGASAGSSLGTSAAFKGANAAGLAAALPLIQAQAPQYGLDPNLVAALVYQESRFNPTIVSPKGARGLGQLMPGTAAGLGVSDSFDIQQNLTGTFTYLQQLTAQFKGDVQLVLAAYNAGPGAVTKYGGIPPYKETQGYVKNVLATRNALAGSTAGTGPLSPVAQLDELLQQKKGLEAYLEAQKAMAKGTEEAAKAAEAAQARGLRAVEELQRLNEKYTFTPEETDRAKAARLVALTQSGDATRALALEQQANIEVGIALKEKADALQKVADVSFLEFQSIAKSTDALRAYQEQLELSGGALDIFGRLQKTTAEARAVMQSESRLKNLPPELQAEGATVIERLRKAAMEATPLYKSLTTASDAFADSFLSSIEQVTQGSIKSFKQFADSVIQDLLRIASQQFLKPALSGLFKAGIDAALAYFGGTGGGDFGGTGPSDTGGGGAFASGGIAKAGYPAIVGERGPEVFYPAMDGRVLSHEETRDALQGAPRQAAAPVYHITLNVHGVQDASSFVRSRGEVQRAALQAFQQAQRAA